MAAAGQETEAHLRVVARLALRQDAQTDANHRIRSERQAGREIRPPTRNRRRGERLLAGQPFGETARLFAPAWRFVDLGREDRIGLEADLRKELKPARRSRPKHETKARVRGGAIVAPLESQGHLKR